MVSTEIKILGTGCAACKALYETVAEAVASTGVDATVEKEEDIVRIISYGVMALPALVIDGKVVAKGRKLTLSEAVEFLNKHKSGNGCCSLPLPR